MRAASARFWGWHRLTDKWAERIVADAGVRPGELVLDVGAGTGTLTRALLDAGAKVVAIELHPARVAALRQRFAGDRVKVVRADASQLYLPRRPFRVVANPPFAVTAALMRRLVGRGSQLIAADLVLPEWVARRYANGGLRDAVRVHATFGIETGRSLPRSAFVPEPPCRASMLVIRRRNGVSRGGGRNRTHRTGVYPSHSF